MRIRRINKLYGVLSREISCYRGSIYEAGCRVRIAWLFSVATGGSHRGWSPKWSPAATRQVYEGADGGNLWGAVIGGGGTADVMEACGGRARLPLFDMAPQRVYKMAA